MKPPTIGGIVIVSRHPAAVEFIRSEMPAAAGAPVLASATPDDVRNRVVVGNLPLHLACLAREVWAVEFAGSAPRGAEYGIDEMRAAGARLQKYVVRTYYDRRRTCAICNARRMEAAYYDPRDRDICGECWKDHDEDARRSPLPARHP